MARAPKEPHEEVSYSIRFQERLRAEVAESAKENGRSINAELVHRLDGYERMKRAYSVATSDTLAQKLLISLAHLLDEIDRNSEPKGSITPLGDWEPDFKKGKTIRPELIDQMRELTAEEARGAAFISQAKFFLDAWQNRVMGLDGKIDFSDFSFMGADSIAVEPHIVLQDQIDDTKAKIKIEKVIAKQPGLNKAEIELYNGRVAESEAELARLEAQAEDIAKAAK